MGVSPVPRNQAIFKRIVPIMIEPTSANPEARTDFQHPDIRAYVRQQRRTVLECLLGLVENWLAAGRPTCGNRLGGFEKRSEVIGGILQVNGLRAWRTNEGEWRKLANPHGSEMETFVEVWHETFGAAEVTAFDLMNMAEQNSLFGFVFTRNGVRLPREVRRRLRAVRHHLAKDKPATLTAAQLAGWNSLQKMVAAQLHGCCCQPPLRGHIGPTSSQ